MTRTKMSKWVDALLWLIAAAIVAGAVAHPPKARADSCDSRWESCQSPRWCETTGTLIPPFSGYCPLGPDNYSPPWTGSDG